MAKYRVLIYSSAERDMEEIIDYVNSLSPIAAYKLYDEIVSKISSLGEMPERCALVKENNLKLKGYRFLCVENYIVFFIIKGKVVQIRRIVYSKRNFNEIL